MSIVVIKIGGEVIDQQDYFLRCIDEWVALHRDGKYTPIIVHGGGKQISEHSTRLGLEPQFRDGLRMTNAAEMVAVEMVLAGRINSAIVRALCPRGVMAVGISGVSAKVLTALPPIAVATEGAPTTAARGNFTARGARCTPALLRTLIANHYTPVVAPIGSSDDGTTYNINADIAAATIARALQAPLVFITDVRGVLDRGGVKLIPHLQYDDYAQLVATGVVRGGMRAKIAACFDEQRPVVKSVVIGMVQKRGDMLSLINHTEGTVIE